MRVLLLTSSTGGGHDMRASSFEQWAGHPNSSDLEIITDRLQVLENTHSTYRFGVTLYNKIQQYAPWLHHIYFVFLEEACLHKRATGILGRKVFEERLVAIKPDVIVSTHAHLNHGFFKIARDVLGKRNVRCVTYCGELFGGYGFSKHWVNSEADLFIGAVEETCQEAARLGMGSERNWVGGFLLNPKFYEKPMTRGDKLRFIEAELGLDPDKFILILATGANGANNHLNLLRSLSRSGMSLQVVALCGNNHNARKDIDSWASLQANISVKTLPYYKEMNRLMQVASAIVARPGTGTTSEAILTGCPIIFNGIGGVMPQEYITLKYARKYGVGKLMMSASALPSCIKDWLDPEALAAQKRCMSDIRPQSNPIDILKKIAN